MQPLFFQFQTSMASVPPHLFELTRHKGGLLDTWFATSVLINALFTIAIATKRISELRKTAGQVGFDNASSLQFWSALTRILFVEAAFPPSLCALAMAIAYGTQSSYYDKPEMLACRIFAALWLASSVRGCFPSLTLLADCNTQ